MSQQTSGYSAPAGSPTDPPTTQVARDQAGEVGRTTSDAGKRVAATAADQAGQVADEARRQARDLFGEARSQATEQARTGQQKAGEGLRSLADELHQMADGGDQHGPASDLAKQAADKLGDVADWLTRREPGELVDEFRAMARRRPGVFLLGAAVAGVVAGRLTRGAVDANRDSGSPNSARTPVTPVTPVTASDFHYRTGAPSPLPADSPAYLSPDPAYPSTVSGRPVSSNDPTPPQGFAAPISQPSTFTEPTDQHLPPEPRPYTPDTTIPRSVDDAPVLPPRPHPTVDEYVEDLDRTSTPPPAEYRPDPGGQR